MSMTGTAIGDGTYRYLLTRTWRPDLARVVWVMLNPSTADAQRDDCTIRKCVGFAMRWECGGIDVVNLFARRATHPESLAKMADPVGPANNAAILSAIQKPNTWRVVCAWGCDPHHWKDPKLALRTARFLNLIAPTPLWCLGLTGRGSPRHPSRLAYSTPLTLWTPAQEACA